MYVCFLLHSWKLLGRLVRISFFLINFLNNCNASHTSNFCRISLNKSYSCQFGLQLIHMNKNFSIFLLLLCQKYSSFGVAKGLKQGRSCNRKQTYIFFGVRTCIQGLTKKVCSFTCWKKIMIGPKLFYFPMVYYYKTVSFRAKLWCLNSLQKKLSDG